jgi:hypothetical protein
LKVEDLVEIGAIDIGRSEKSVCYSICPISKDCKRYKVEFCSELAFRLARLQINSNIKGNQHKLLMAARGGGAESLAGMIFERMVIEAFIFAAESKSTKSTFDVKYFNSDGTLNDRIKKLYVTKDSLKQDCECLTVKEDSVEILMTSSEECDLTDQKVKGNNDGALLFPVSRHQAIVDFIIVKYALLQVTVGLNHGYVASKLDKMLKGWNWTQEGAEKKLHFFYIVPDDTFTDFKRQDVLTVRKTRRKRQNHIAQVIVKFDVDASLSKMQKPFVLEDEIENALAVKNQ